MKIFVLLSLVCLSGCTSLGTEAWERQNLAKREMLIISEPLESATDDHIYFSKEATSGGSRVRGIAFDARGAALRQGKQALAGFVRSLFTAEAS